MGRFIIFSLFLLTALIFIVAGDWDGPLLQAQITGGDNGNGETQTNGNGNGHLQVTGGGTGRPGRCQITIELTGDDQFRQVNVDVRSEAGIYLAHNAQTGSVDAHHVSFPDNALGAREKRHFHVDCGLESGRAWLAGGYVVEVVVQDIEGQEVYDEGSLLIYVGVDGSGTPSVFSNRDQYLAAFGGYRAGQQDIEYFVSGNGPEFAREGDLYLRVRGRAGEGERVVDVRAVEALAFGEEIAAVNHHALAATRFVDERVHVEGVEFSLNGLWPGSERIVHIPFSVKPGATAGTYRLQMVTHGPAGLVVEQAPYELLVEADPQEPANTWLKAVQPAQLRTIAPAPPVGERLRPMLPAQAAPQPAQPATVPPVTQAVPQEAPAQPAPAEAAPPATSPQAAPEQNPAGWHRRADLDGTLWDVFRLHQQQLQPLRFVDFERDVRANNPTLGERFYPGEAYWFPVP